MKNKSLGVIISRIVYRTCCIFTGLFILLFAISGGFDTGRGTSFGQLLIVLLSSLIIALSLEIFYFKVGKIAKIAINYAVLLIAFFIVFVTVGKLVADTAAKVFVIIVLFTIAYAAICTPIVLILNKKNSNGKKKEKESQEKSESYKSRFS